MNAAQEDNIITKFKILHSITKIMHDDYALWMVSTPEQILKRVMEQTQGHYHPKLILEILTEE